MDITEQQIFRDAMYAATRPSSWVWDESIFSWKAPIDPPNDGYPYLWDEDQLAWIPFPDYPRDDVVIDPQTVAIGS